MDKSMSLLEHFMLVEDPRINRRKKHLLIDIIIITIIAMTCGSNNWFEIVAFAEERIDFLKKFLRLPNGIPSHDTFARVFSLIDPLQMQVAFLNWINQVVKTKEGDCVSLDGKYFKASQAKSGEPRSMIGAVTACLSDLGIVLAVKKTDFKKNGEKKVFKEIIALLNLKGINVTMDAYGCHANITNLILDKGGNYTVALKANQKILLRLVDSTFKNQSKNVDTFESIEKEHGRIETRTCTVMPMPEEIIELLERRKSKRREIKESWNGLRSIVKMVSKREIRGKVSEEIRYYISSLEANAKKLAKVIRSQWGIENRLHYILDTSFKEDHSRSVKGFEGDNLAIIRRLVINLLKKDTENKKSINIKRLKAMLNENYLIKVITSFQEVDFVK